MSMVYRKEKGSALSIEEMDGNFLELDRRLKSLEEEPLAAEGIKDVKVEGDVMRITGSHGTEFGSFRLPIYIPCIKGQWKKGQKYNPGDWVQIKKSLYLCKTFHESKEFVREFNEKLWSVIYESE